MQPRPREPTVRAVPWAAEPRVRALIVMRPSMRPGVAGLNRPRTCGRPPAALVRHDGPRGRTPPGLRVERGPACPGRAPVRDGRYVASCARAPAPPDPARAAPPRPPHRLGARPAGRGRVRR